MLETLEATIDKQGNVKLLESVKLTGRRKALVTILDELPEQANDEWSLVGSVDIVDDDLEGASLEIADEMKRSIERSADELNRDHE